MKIQKLIVAPTYFDQVICQGDILEIAYLTLLVKLCFFRQGRWILGVQLLNERKGKNEAAPETLLIRPPLI